jgi:hypothetical protein
MTRGSLVDDRRCIVKCSCLDTGSTDLHRESFTFDKPEQASIPALFAAALTDGDSPNHIAQSALEAIHNDLTLFEQWYSLVSDSETEGALNPEIVVSVLRRIGERARVAAEISRRIASAKGSSES